jgi:succinyl-CoA synthetase alpha subunit
MSILLGRNTRVLVHGASSTVGAYQTGRMRAYGTHVVGVVSREPTLGHELPTYSNLTEAQLELGADLVVSYASGRYLKPTATECFEAGIGTVVVVAEEVRFRDVVSARSLAREVGAIMVGPNTNGILTPGEAFVGTFAPDFGLPGRVGVISRSGTLGYGALLEMMRAGIGQSTVVGIGGAMARGLSAAEALRQFEEDPATDAVLMLGETGSHEEEGVAELVGSGTVGKPVAAFVVGRVGRANELMGHAGAVVYDSGRTFADKVSMLSEAGVAVISHLGDLAETVQSILPVEAMSPAVLQS